MNFVLRLLKNRYARRLAVALATLAIVDRYVPAEVARAERVRYESGQIFRFENSDLFVLGPMVEYLRERPNGGAPRVVFFGDSVVWGYGVRPTQTVAAQFQRLVPGERVFNFGINGFGTPAHLLIATPIIESVNTMYLFDIVQAVDPLLPSLIPIDAVNLKLYGLQAPNRLESELRRRASPWNLYHYSYRLQAAWFGMSTRLFVYFNKSQLARAPLRAIRPPPPAAPAVVDEPPVMPGVVVTVPRAPARPTQDRILVLSNTYPSQWRFAQLAREHGRETVIVELQTHAGIEDEQDLADLNAEFNPSVQFVQVSVPKSMRPDTSHFSPEGARAVAHALFTLRQASRVKP